ncbi:protoporphyrinogen oxidase HemJ [Hoeflea poritis]|uniref:Protoporphyrinogen IX oxidase n=1 Tax=Hoeflea poritis TaxID=2993659 RepID=A0ABT4VL10_9HYPH|nr:protoporphyrinogen oxidase HemJ [Hoeflea poritis]MDA4845350.1 protoporphyrinogen oxidase HemJ [Hoeflea poritis]
MASNDGKDETAGNKARLRARIALAVVVAAVIALMAWNPPELYDWIKAVHVIAIISWMAGLLYLPRLFVYHSDSDVGSQQSETFKVMEARLYKVIMTPAMVIAWVLGLWLAYDGFGFNAVWLWLKIAAVLALSGVHDYLGRAVRRFAEDHRDHPARHWRMINEVPTVLMIFIVVMVIVKPF